MKMILSEEYVLRAIELRVKTKQIVGTLCIVPAPHAIHAAMLYMDTWNDGPYLSNPFTTLEDSIMKNMTRDLFRIFIEFVHHWKPPFTLTEINSIMVACNKFGYLITRYNDTITFRRDINHESVQSGFRDRTHSRN